MEILLQIFILARIWFTCNSQSKMLSLQKIFPEIKFIFLIACDSTSKNKQAFFHQRDGIDVASSFAASLTIGSFASNSKMQCFASCNINCECFMAKYESNICTLYSKNASLYLVNNTNNIGNVYMRKKYF